MALPVAVVEELRRVVGREFVIDSANDLRIFERDASIEGALPDAVVLPATTEQVAGVIKAAAKSRIPVVMRGAGTGLSGGAVTIRGGIALQVTRMRRILEIDPVAQTALVEPGVVSLADAVALLSWRPARLAGLADLCLGCAQVAQVPDVEQVEVAVGEGDPAPRGGQLGEPHGELRLAQDGAHRSSSSGRRSARMTRRSSSGVSVAVPAFMTTTPPA